MNDYLSYFLKIIVLNVLLADVAWFSEALERYHGQHKLAEVIREKRPIGMLLVDAVNMKKLIIPSPLRCLDVGDMFDNYTPIR